MENQNNSNSKNTQVQKPKQLSSNQQQIKQMAQNQNRPTKICKKCGMEIPKIAKICPHCRKKQPSTVKTIVGIIVAIILLSIIFGNNNSSSSTSPSSNITNTSTNKTTIGLNETFKNKTIEGIVTDVDFNYTGYNDYLVKVPEDSKAIKVTIKVTNISEKSNYVSIGDFRCYVDDIAFDAEIFDGNYNENIDPGRSAILEGIYIIPINSENIELEYHPIGETSDRIIINLGKNINNTKTKKSNTNDIDSIVDNINTVSLDSTNISKESIITIESNKSDLDNFTRGQQNAIKSAESYLNHSSFSKEELIHQLEFEKYTSEEASFAIEYLEQNNKVNWYDEAVESAESYLSHSSFSKEELIHQLEFEGYTDEEALSAVELVY